MSLKRKIKTAVRLVRDGDIGVFSERLGVVTGLIREDKAPSGAQIRIHNTLWGASSPFVLSPERRKRKFAVRCRPSEPVQVTLYHRDALLADERKSLILWVDVAGQKPSEALATQMGLNFNGSRLFAYLGGGRINKGLCRTNLNIATTPEIRWLGFTLESRFERYVNFDRITFGHAELIERQKAINPSALDDFDLSPVRNILMAEIDLNVVDGSSIWLSSMASILCKRGPTVLLARTDIQSDVITANIRHTENLRIIQPADLGRAGDTFDANRLYSLAKAIDAVAPRLDTVVVRGLKLASLTLSDRQFYDRVETYLTDFYVHEGDGIIIPEDRRLAVDTVTRQARRQLVQTEEIGNNLAQLSGVSFKKMELPPPVPVFYEDFPLERKIGRPVRIGYVGKIAPDWGVIELFDWTESLRAKGYQIELTIICNKVSSGGSEDERKRFRHLIAQRMKDLNVVHYDGLPRTKAIETMSEMDFAWCWRPPHFEAATLELSTKLVEGIANGQACIAYGNRINRNALGENYPFFIEGQGDLQRLLDQTAITLDRNSIDNVRLRHSLAALEDSFAAGLPLPENATPLSICVSGHDFKFIDPWVSYLRRQGHSVWRDQWNWGEPVDIERSQRLQEKSDIIFAEWGLANAVWQSNNLPADKKLFVRIHLQEINQKAKRFGFAINAENVTRFIFVSDRVRNEAVNMFGWPVEKTIVIPNFVLDDEYRFDAKTFDGPVKLGMVGIIPERKRLDRGLDLLEALIKSGIDAELHIKGPRPGRDRADKAPVRPEEAQYYESQYARIEGTSLEGKVIFHPWGNDVASFYTQIDHILSPSDFESFHYALADGVLSGCQPVVWPWEEAFEIYREEWIVPSVDAAVEKIRAFRLMSPAERRSILTSNREFVVGKFGRTRIFKDLEDCLSVDAGAAGE